MMTLDGQREIVDVLHGLELRMTERMVRVETRLDAWLTMQDDVERRLDSCEKKTDTLEHELNAKAIALAAATAAEREASRERSTRLTVGMIVVALIAGTDVATRIAAGGLLS